MERVIETMWARLSQELDTLRQRQLQIEKVLHTINIHFDADGSDPIVTPDPKPIPRGHVIHWLVTVRNGVDITDVAIAFKDETGAYFPDEAQKHRKHGKVHNGYLYLPGRAPKHRRLGADPYSVEYWTSTGEYGCLDPTIIVTEP